MEDTKLKYQILDLSDQHILLITTINCLYGGWLGRLSLK